LSEKERIQKSDSSEEQEQLLPGYLGESPPYGQLPARGGRVWVDRPEQLQQAASMLKQAPIVAIDAEFTQARPYNQIDLSTSTPRLALLQLAIDGQCFVIDALRLRDLTPLADVVDNRDIRTLLHGAGADLRVMGERELFVTYYYDLEAISRSIFGQHESSLATMLKHAFNARLDKSLQRTDWTRRPLPPAMVAYAARDAEMTLALYYWLSEHFPWALLLHDSDNLQVEVATWIEPFLRGTSSLPADVVVAEAIKQGSIRDREQLVSDCRVALETLVHPMLRSRLLRLISDLALTQLMPDIEPLLNAPAADVRASAIRALGRMDSEHNKEAILPLLEDPVHDVRKAAQSALRSPGQKTGKANAAAPVRNEDGTRSWTVGASNESGNAGDDDWKARLRSIMGE
jgi:3'-5' exonuclease/HEAT repeats